ncbi:MAG: hypothetical protein ABI828_06190 [Actinomycetota bacterium]
MPGTEVRVEAVVGVGPCGDMMKYWAFSLDAVSVLPKCVAAKTASAAIWFCDAEFGAAPVVSSHTPASAPPVG